jgi:hypothetical protein
MKQKRILELKKKIRLEKKLRQHYSDLAVSRYEEIEQLKNQIITAQETAIWALKQVNKGTKQN